MHQPIERCRICGNHDLRPIIDLGRQALTGIFPSQADAPLSTGPLELVRCAAAPEGTGCGLVQLRHSFDIKEMYGANYGYRSSLNRSMVDHLRGKVAKLLSILRPAKESLVIDVGSNDGTLLSFYPEGMATLVGIDPTAAKFRSYYRPDIQIIPDFFSAAAVRAQFADKRADVVTSIAMFYDLEDPLAFVRQVAEVLSPGGLWHFEQSYLPSMLATTSYDTICHEHIEYYALRQIVWLLDLAGLRVIDVELNDVNGGSFAVTACHKTADHPRHPRVDKVLAEEEAIGLGKADPYAAFARGVERNRSRLLELLGQLRSQGAKVLGYGASTKGNVILQYCGLTARDIPCIAEVNADKFGHVTPGSHIPIVSEAQAHQMKPDYFLVLPWHFRANLLKREGPYLKGGGRMIFPLPEVEVVSR